MKKKLTLVYPHCEDAKRTERLNGILQDILDVPSCVTRRISHPYRAG